MKSIMLAALVLVAILGTAAIATAAVTMLHHIRAKLSIYGAINLRIYGIHIKIRSLTRT